MSWSLQYYDENIPCLAACPVHTNAGLYVAAIADGNDRLAYETARLPNPFASVCGRVCAAPCEDACRRGKIDRPIAIRALKRYLTEQYGPESGHAVEVTAPGETRATSIGIVGGGPAGLACAHDLRLQGHRVTVYEATDRLGGAMWLGIPEYRLERSVLQGDIDAIIGLGVEVELNTRLGTDLQLDDLRDRHDAVFLAIGATLGRNLDIPGHDADGVFKAIEFLINMNRGFEVEIGQRVVVVGGGDVAMDAARVALRADDYDDQRSAMVTALDAARTAARFGARHVTVVSLESQVEMPAHEFEVGEAIEEGIEFVHRRGPARIEVVDGKVSGIETIGVRSVFDENGRFAPTFEPDDLRVIPADTVILAIGQQIDLDCLGSQGPEVSPRRTIKIEPDTGSTSIEGVWSGGDAAKGPRTLIDAIADGRRSAADIHRHLTGEVHASQPGHQVIEPDFRRLGDHYDRLARVPVPVLLTHRRVGLAEVELGYTPEQARCEASRCLLCFANIEFNTSKCVLCALCVDVCPVDVLSLVSADRVGGPSEMSALLLDEERCIRCALCVERCPTKALAVSVWSGVGVPKWT